MKLAIDKEYYAANQPDVYKVIRATINHSGNVYIAAEIAGVGLTFNEQGVCLSNPDIVLFKETLPDDGWNKLRESWLTEENVQ